MNRDEKGNNESIEVGNLFPNLVATNRLSQEGLRDPNQADRMVRYFNKHFFLGSSW